MTAGLTSGPLLNADLTRQSAGLGRGPNLIRRQQASSVSNTWPMEGATLDLDFVNNRGYVRGYGSGGVMDAITFTRASSGTYINAAGVLAYGGGNGLNLFNYPQNFENSYWNKSNATVVPNSTIAPDGTKTGYQLLDNTVNTNHYIDVYSSISVTNGQTYTRSIYIKYYGIQWAIFNFYDTTSNFTYFDIVNGVVGTVATGCTAAIQNVGNGWFRCSVTKTVAASSLFLAVGPTTGNGVTGYVGTGSAGIFIWGSQLELGSSATTYFPTNINAPRFDYSSAPVANKNLTLGSTSLSNTSYWSQNQITIASTVAVNDPFGGTSACILLETAVNNTHYSLQTITAIGPTPKTYTASLYVQYNGRQWIEIQLGSSSTYFDLINGVTGASSGTSATITNVGNSWWRITHTFTTNSSPQFVIKGASANGTDSYVGNTSLGYYIYGPQVEFGSSATSYQAISYNTSSTPLVATSVPNGILIEESKTNSLFWCRNASVSPNRNILPYSQTFNAAAWTIQNATLTANTITAPDSTTTGYTLTTTATNNVHGINTTNSFAASATTVQQTYSVYLQAGTTNYASIIINNGYINPTSWAAISVNLTAGTITQTGIGSSNNYTIISSSITAVGSWYRVVITYTTTAPGSYANIYINNTATPTNGSYGRQTWTALGTETIYVWGAQLEYGSTATTYEATTTNGAYWPKLGITASLNQTGIDGYPNTATSLTATTSNAFCMQTTSTASAAFTSSIYLKAITVTGSIYVTVDGINFSYVDLSNGLWNRIIISSTLSDFGIGILIQNSGDSVAMDFAQVEGGSNATSPIPTTTATVTRSADVATIGGALFNSFYNQEQGTVFFNAITKRQSSTDACVVGFQSGGSNIFTFFVSNYTAFNAIQSNFGYCIAGTTSNMANNNITIKFASSYKPSNANKSTITQSINGDTSVPYFTAPTGSDVIPLKATSMSIGGQVNAGAPVDGYINRLVFFPKTFTSSALQLMTGTTT